MGKFKFRLQNLLDIRIKQEEECKIAFKIAQDEKLKAEEKLSDLNSNFDKYSNLRMKVV